MVKVKILETNSTNFVTVEGEMATTIGELRASIEEKWQESYESISGFRTRLIYKGKILGDSQKLSDINITETEEEEEINTFLLMIPPPDMRVSNEEAAGGNNNNQNNGGGQAGNNGNGGVAGRSRNCCVVV